LKIQKSNRSKRELLKNIIFSLFFTNLSYTVFVETAKKAKGGTTMAHIDLTRMKAGESGTVVAVHGGYGMVTRLEAIGIRPEVVVTKISSQIMHGPVTVRVGNTQIAIGFGMARRVIVSID
jgi:ferrous iron transport protein A